MAKLIEYQMLTEVNHGTSEEPNIERTPTYAEIACATQAIFDANYPIAEKEAIPGTIKVSGAFDYPTAPRNILADEYVTVDGVMYKAIINIPNGEPIIVGQNAVVTTIEEHLAELAKGE